MDSPSRRNFDPWYDEFERPFPSSSRFATHPSFRTATSGFENDEDLLPASSWMYSRYPFRHPRSHPRHPGFWSNTGRDQRVESGLSDLKVGADKFSVKVDVHQFTPEEVVVKTKDNNLIVEAKHEEKEDPHGFISRHFVRRYALPEGVQADQLVGNLSSDGILEIEAPIKALLLEGESLIPILQTGRPAVFPTMPRSVGGSKVDESEGQGQTRNIAIEKELTPSTSDANLNTK